MKTTPTVQQRRGARQAGATAVEFAIVVTLFLLLLVGMMEMGRVLFYWNSAAEATRLGARMAAVCDLNDSAVKARMQNILSMLSASNISIAYLPGGCDDSTCRTVTVSIASGATVATYLPFVAPVLTLPPFSTTLPRESMRSTVDGVANPVCD